MAGPWPAWARNTAAAAAGAGLMLVTSTVAFQNSRRDAESALDTVHDHEPRIRILESHDAEQIQSIREAKEAMKELQVDVKELLRRIPSK